MHMLIYRSWDEYNGGPYFYYVQIWLITHSSEPFIISGLDYLDGPYWWIYELDVRIKTSESPNGIHFTYPASIEVMVTAEPTAIPASSPICQNKTKTEQRELRYVEKKAICPS